MYLALWLAVSLLSNLNSKILFAPPPSCHDYFYKAVIRLCKCNTRTVEGLIKTIIIITNAFLHWQASIGTIASTASSAILVPSIHSRPISRSATNRGKYKLLIIVPSHV